MPRIDNVVKVYVYKIPGRIKKLKERGKGDLGEVEATKSFAPPKSTWQGQPHAISRRKDEVFQIRKMFLPRSRIEPRRFPILHNDRKGRPAIESLQYRGSVRTKQSEA